MKKLNKIARKYGLKGFYVKIKDDMRESTEDFDSRGALEGMWKMLPEKANEADFVLGVNNLRVFCVYRMVKGSARRILDLTRGEWDSFLELQRKRGRIELHTDYDQNKERTIFELIPIAPPKGNRVKIEKPTETEKNFIDEVMDLPVDWKPGESTPFRYINI